MRKQGQDERALKLTDDLVFKAVYGREDPQCKKAMIALLNLVLDRKADPITAIEYKNPFSLQEDVTAKELIMDIKAETERGEILDVEMQTGKLGVYKNRSVFYGGNLIVESLEKGQDYDMMKKSVVISFINGTLFSETARCHSIFRYMEITERFELSNISELHFIELGKIEAEKPVCKMEPLERFGAYIRYATEEKMTGFVTELIDSGEEVIRLTEPLLREAAEDEILKERQRARDLWEHDWASLKALAKKEGRAEGLEEGRAEGLEEGRAEGLEEGRAEGRMESVEVLVKALLELEVPRDMIEQKLLDKFKFTGEAASELLDKVQS